MRQLYPHNPKAKLEGFIISGEAMKVVRRRTPPKPCFLFRHDSFPNEELYANKKNVVITAEGSPEHFFVPVAPAPPTAEEIQAEQATIQERIEGTGDEINIQDVVPHGAHGNLVHGLPAHLGVPQRACENNNAAQQPHVQ